MLTSTLGDQVNSLIDSSQRRNVNGLLTHNTAGSDSGRILTRSTHQQGSDKHLQWVFAGQEIDDLECVADNSDGFCLFTSVSAVELEGSYESFNNGAEGFSELFGLVSAGSVGYEDLGFD